MLKIWNLNKFAGVLGAFNCQGGGWCPKSRRNKSATEYSRVVTCLAGPKDVEWGTGKSPISIKGVDTFAVCLFQQKKLKLLKSSESLEISLQPFDYEVLTVSPVKILPGKSIQFAPVGLVNMLNSGGAIQSLASDDHECSASVGIRVSCQINGLEVDFGYDDDYMITVHVRWRNSSKWSVVEFLSMLHMDGCCMTY